MMSRLGLVCLFLLLAFSFVIQAQVVNVENYSPKHRALIKKNNIRFIIGWSYQYKNGVQAQYGSKSSFQKFDKEGNVVEEVAYKQSGETQFECTRAYDDASNETSTIGLEHQRFFSKKWIYKKITEHETEKLPYKVYNSKERYVMTFDKLGNKIQEQKYDEDGTFMYNRFFKYDSRNNLVERLELDGSGNLFEKWEYNYDDKQNNVQTLRYDNEGKVFLKYIFVHDDKGNPLEEIIYNAAEQPVQKTKYLYQPFTW